MTIHVRNAYLKDNHGNPLEGELGQYPHSETYFVKVGKNSHEYPSMDFVESAGWQQFTPDPISVESLIIESWKGWDQAGDQSILYYEPKLSLIFKPALEELQAPHVDSICIDDESSKIQFYTAESGTPFLEYTVKLVPFNPDKTPEPVVLIIENGQSYIASLKDIHSGSDDVPRIPVTSDTHCLNEGWLIVQVIHL